MFPISVIFEYVLPIHIIDTCTKYFCNIMTSLRVMGLRSFRQPVGMQYFKADYGVIKLYIKIIKPRDLLLHLPCFLTVFLETKKKLFFPKKNAN